MAETVLRHAAAGQPTYEVHELSEGDPPLRLGLRYSTPDYGAAVEYACEYLEHRDPQRVGEVSALEVVRVAPDGKRESVWQYSHDRRTTAQVDLVGRWGFDVTRRWHAPTTATPKARLAAPR
jgi:hypothetical protein